MEYSVTNEQDMQNLVVGVLNKICSSSTLKKATVLALNGDLGTGKTTFTKALAKELGIAEHITSPTFVIQKSYKIPVKTPKESNSYNFTKLVHIDAYRLESSEEAHVLGFSEMLQQQGTLVVVEWADNIEGALPRDSLCLSFAYCNEVTRSVTIGGILSDNE